MIEDLENVGLSHKEASVYLAILKIGPASITEIAQKSGINRTTIYDVINELLKEGLIANATSGKKMVFAAEPLEKLPLFLENRSKNFEEKAKKARTFIAELKLLVQKQPGKPKVRIFEGKEGVKELYEDTLFSKGDIFSFSSTQSLEEFDQEYLHNYYKRRAQKRIFIRAIINDVPTAREYQKQDKMLYREIRIVPKDMMSIRPEVYIYENKVAFFSLKEEYAVLVESLDIAVALKKLFELAWLGAEKFQKK